MGVFMVTPSFNQSSNATFTLWALNRIQRDQGQLIPAARNRISLISSHPQLDPTLHARALLSKINPALE